MEFQPTRSTSFWRSMETVGEKLQESNVFSVGEPISHRGRTDQTPRTTMCIVEHALNARSLTPVISDVSDLEALNPNHFLLGNRNVCLPYLPCAEEFVDHRKLFRQTQAYANLIWDRFRKEYLPTLNNRLSLITQKSN